ncbi:DEAD/DEAH box helicase [Nevskia sp.]|uniref:DEAD/DEAH box helicase n=1 Tax=Nevskia sp. TaxID=1929292 RepID=UPI0025ED0990|nr:DEAD/DEAH box helicase [Nevskia sp.]
MSDSAAETSVTFRDLALSEHVLEALDAVGYESPSPIQGATIPHLLSGRDVLGQAQTGTGKTAAFALPILSKLDAEQRLPQALVLAPTRELAIQVAEAFQKYAAKIPGFHVLPIYGGQSYGPQLSALKRGVHVVVGTPGRVLDHMKRGTLDLSQIKCLVLDEADEMLRMGFIEDVEYVLKETPPQRQVALFSATMPAVIRRIAQTYLKDPAEVTIKSKTSTATNIRQRYWLVSGYNKLDALTRILEAESFDGMIIFARTKAATQELADKLEARGYNVAALNGDMEQRARELTVNRLKDGRLDIVVATDVAARGLDVERISHVFNYDIPTDTESYVHRIGRTGRAGRSGEAILFVSPRERHMLKLIERATRQPITPMELPSIEAVNTQRIARFTQKIADALESGGLDPFRQILTEFERERNVTALDIAAALAKLVQGDADLLLDDVPEPPKARGYTVESSASAPPRREYERRERPERGDRPERTEQSGSSLRPRPARPDAPPRAERPERIERPERASRPEAASFERRPPATADRGDDAPRPKRTPREEAVPMETFRVEVGHAHGVKPGNIVGAIANEAGVESSFIGRIEIENEYSLVDLPAGMPKEIFRDLQKVWVVGRQLKLSRLNAPPAKTPYEASAGPRPKPKKPRPA